MALDSASAGSGRVERQWGLCNKIREPSTYVE